MNAPCPTDKDVITRFIVLTGRYSRDWIGAVKDAKTRVDDELNLLIPAGRTPDLTTRKRAVTITEDGVVSARASVQLRPKEEEPRYRKFLRTCLPLNYPGAVEDLAVEVKRAGFVPEWTTLRVEPVTPGAYSLAITVEGRRA